MPATLPEPYASIKLIDPSTFRAFSAEGEFLLDMDPDGARDFVAAGHAKWGTAPPPVVRQVRLMRDEPIYTSAGLAPHEVDGKSVKAGDLILLTGQPKAEQNGIYTVVKTHSDHSPYGGTWVRLDTPTTGILVTVTSGEVYGSTMWCFSGTEWTHLTSGSGS